MERKRPELLRREDVLKVAAHQCQLGQQTDEGDPTKKLTGLMSNAPGLLTALGRRGVGKHGLNSRPQGGTQVQCLGKKAQRSALF